MFLKFCLSDTGTSRSRFTEKPGIESGPDPVNMDPKYCFHLPTVHSFTFSYIIVIKFLSPQMSKFFQEMYPISHYINDRPEMINQVNNIVTGIKKNK